jgi:hypothetical protein
LAVVVLLAVPREARVTNPCLVLSPQLVEVEVEVEMVQDLVVLLEFLVDLAEVVVDQMVQQLKLEEMEFLVKDLLAEIQPEAF